MTFIGDMNEAVDRLAVFAELDVDPSILPASVAGLSDTSVRELLSDTAAIVQTAQKLQTIMSGVIAQRSTRDLGHEGLAAKGGSRSPVEMVGPSTSSGTGDRQRQPGDR